MKGRQVLGPDEWRGDVERIRKVLLRERRWRERVFRGEKQRRKVEEIDIALAALARLESALERNGLIVHQARLWEQQMSTTP